MKLSHEKNESMAVYTVKGDLTADQVEDLRKLASQHMSQSVRDFVLDVSEMEFIDSAGLETLIWLQESCAEKLGQLRLASPTANVEKILEMTRLAGRIDRHADVGAAIKSLR